MNKKFHKNPRWNNCIGRTHGEQSCFYCILRFQIEQKTKEQVEFT